MNSNHVYSLNTVYRDHLAQPNLWRTVQFQQTIWQPDLVEEILKRGKKIIIMRKEKDLKNNKITVLGYTKNKKKGKERSNQIKKK